MTREELREHCEKQIEDCEMWAKRNRREPRGKIYEEHKLILELLEQETVSKESYDHEYFLRKELDLKVDKLQRQLDKIKAEIENDWQLKQYPSSPFSCGLRRAIEIIDKYKAESEEKDPDRVITVPEEATNGDAILAVFCDAEPYQNNGVIETDIDGGTLFNEDWWNAPYKAESEE